MIKKRFALYLAVISFTFFAGFVLERSIRIKNTIPRDIQGPGVVAESQYFQSLQKPYTDEPAYFRTNLNYQGQSKVAKLGEPITLSWGVPHAACVRIRDVSSGDREGQDLIKSLSAPYASLGFYPEPGVSTFTRIQVTGRNGWGVELTPVTVKERRYELIAYTKDGEELMRLYTSVPFPSNE